MNKHAYLLGKINSFNPDQKVLFGYLQINDKLQLCMPTGGGKNYIMIIDILNQLIKTKNKIFTISSHRLMLNNQHLNDIFEIFSPMLGDIGFIFVGSSKYDYSKFQNNVEFNKKLLKKKLSYNEIISSTTSMKEVDELTKNHIDNGRKVVILTTYHSLMCLKNLDISTIYCDEAHTLATEEDGAKFKENFESIHAIRKLFFTATPKDCFEDTESFLMNNEEIFGIRKGLKFSECVEKGYIVKPIIQIAIPTNFDPTLQFKSVKNMAKFVTDTFLYHKDWLKNTSFDPSKIAPKMLVKCSSVDEMWKIHAELVGKIPGVKICAGASKNDLNNFLHFIDNDGITGRSEYLEKIQNFGENEMAIVLHYDTMSEGINVDGFTAVMFLGGKLPSKFKILQNTGRATRLHKFDRDRLNKGEIMVGDGKWIKANCVVIIPYWDHESEFTQRELANQIKDLRDNFGYDPHVQISLGSDIGSGKKEDDPEALNKKDEKDKKSEIIKQIRNEMEILDKEEMDLKEYERVSKLSKLELLKEEFGN